MFDLRKIAAALIVICLPLLWPFVSYCISSTADIGNEQAVIDYRTNLNPHFKKVVRKKTKYIIVHTSECDLKTTLKLISKGKQDNYKWITSGGHAHYVVARDGTTFYTLDEQFKAHHAGLSVWNGLTCLNNISVGIELVGYHDKEITTNQYQSIRALISILKERYQLDDSSVLTHSQVAYSKPNQWKPFNHRGRKHCARNFDRIRAGLNYNWPYDPDVKTGRLRPDPVLSPIFYRHGPKGITGMTNVASRVIDPDNTIFAIAGEKYDSPNTLYKLPDGWVISGNRIESRIGWHHIPTGTEVFLD